MAGKTRKKSSMSDDHLQALAKGRSEGSAVRRYLVALESHKPKRGRKRTAESMKKRLDVLEKSLATADPVTRLHLLQERLDLEHGLQSNDDAVDLQVLEDDFIKAAKTYGDRKKISYQAWREAGVDAAVLKLANIRRSPNA